MRTRLDQRAGEYTARTGATKQVGRAVKLSARRIRQIRDASCPGAPQKTLEWLDGLAADRACDPLPLIEMLLVRVYERRAAAGAGRPWEAICADETRAQGCLDLIQLCARGERTPEKMERLMDAAGEHVHRLLELIGAAHAELAGGTR